MPLNVLLQLGVSKSEPLREVLGLGLPWGDIYSHRDEFPLLRGVDPYDNTYFGQLQMRDLVDELGRVKPFAGPDDRERLDRVLELAAMGITKPGHFLIFVGD